MAISSSNRPVDFYFGIGSRYSYLASTQIEALECNTGARVSWRPILSQELMVRRGQNPFGELNADGKWQGAAVSQTYTEDYRQTDLRRWAELYGAPYNEPPPPKMNSARRTLYCAAAGMLGHAAAYSRAMFRAVYVERLAVDESDCLVMARGCGLDTADLQRIVDDGRARAHHDETVQRAIALGVFGVPTFVWNGALYFGNDRIVLLKKALLSA
jgi:2-hydroxychromene-2-carboxylate isomerase